MIGKRVKCPKCGARFVLKPPPPTANEPEEVPLYLAEPGPPAAPMTGTSPRWVPDEPSPVLPPVKQPDTLPGDSVDPDLMSFLTSKSAESAGDAPVAVPRISADLKRNSPDVLDRLKSHRRKSPAIPMLISIAVALCCAVVGGVWALNQRSNRAASPPPIRINAAYQQSIAARAASNEDAKSLSPTTGKPIPIDNLPFTPHVVCHLHPAELWKNEKHTSEFQALLSTLGIWLKEQIKTRTRFEPEEISELTFAINFGPRLSEPDVAAVVRLKKEHTDQELMKRFNGRIYADPTIELYEASDFSYLKIDQQTFVVAPSNMSESLAVSLNDPASLSPDLAPLMQQSDRDRHLSLLFDVRIVDSHREDAFDEQTKMLADSFLFWFGEDVQTVSWSVHLEPDLYMETLLHHTQASTPAKLHRFTQRKLSNLPEEILRSVRMMKPASVGSRAMIGRFPAMLKAVEIGTSTHIDPAGVRLITLLPQHAASNLAAGAMLTWSQSLVSDFNDDSNLTTPTEETVPSKVADRLKTRILIDFRATPLQEAFGYIGETIKAEIMIDGDALKAAGFTQNMPQTYSLGSVTALKAIDTILQKYAGERDPMVLVIDEDGNKLMLSTVSKARDNGLTVFETRE